MGKVATLYRTEWDVHYFFPFFFFFFWGGGRVGEQPAVTDDSERATQQTKKDKGAQRVTRNRLRGNGWMATYCLFFFLSFLSEIFVICLDNLS